MTVLKTKYCIHEIKTKHKKSLFAHLNQSQNCSFDLKVYNSTRFSEY